MSYILMIIPWLMMVGHVVWYTGSHDRKTTGRWLRAENETVLQAVREWFKALGFLVASVAAIFAFLQFEIADRRLRSDQRPWISMSPPTAEDVKLDAQVGLFWTARFLLKNSGQTPGLHVAVALEPMSANTEQARTKVCGYAEQSRNTITLFPKDEVSTTAVTLLATKELAVFADLLPETAAMHLGGSFLLCIAYKSSLDDQFHHTGYALDLETNGLVGVDVVRKKDRRSDGDLTGNVSTFPAHPFSFAD